MTKNELEMDRNENEPLIRVFFISGPIFLVSMAGNGPKDKNNLPS